MPRLPHEAAVYAQYVTAPSRQLHSPQRLSDVEAAALPMAALTAWLALVETADVRPGERVARARGGRGHRPPRGPDREGTWRSRHLDGEIRQAGFLAESGVDEAIDYSREVVGDVVRDVDVVLDLVGGETALQSLPTLRDGGLLIGVSSGTDVAREAARDRIRVLYLLVEPDRGGLEAVAALADCRALRVHVARTFPLAEAARAHELGETGRIQGKVG